MKIFFRELLEEVRNQPQHIREIFMWLCVVITFSVISLFWFQSTSKQFVAMVNPDRIEEERVYALNNKVTQPSLLATIGSSWTNLKLGLSDLLGAAKKSGAEQFHDDKNDPVPPNLFPTSGDK